MSLNKPLLPECFLHWTEPDGADDEETLRLVTWRRSLTLKGTSFRDFEASVFPLLDGSREVSDICDRVADFFDSDAVLASLNMLAEQGILVEGDGEVAPAGSFDRTPQLGWLSENAPEGRAAQQKLATAHVVLFGAGAHGAVAARALVAAGIGTLTIVDPGEVTGADLYFSSLFKPEDIGRNRAEALTAALGDPGQTMIHAHGERPADAGAIRPLIESASLVLCCLDSGELNLAQMLNIACRDLRKPWFASSMEGTEIVIGPGFFHTEGSPCFMCWRLREIAAASNPQTRFALEQHLDQTHRDLSPRREGLAASADIAGGMLAAEALTVLTGAAMPSLDCRFMLVQVPGLRIEKHVVLRKPGCPVCAADPAQSA